MLSSLVLAGALVPAGCGPAGCSAPPREPALEWRRHPVDPGRSYLFRDGIQVAGYDHESEEYRTYDAATRSWGPPTRPPWIREPEVAAAPRQGTPNFGVDLDRLHAGEERYHLNGVPVSREQAAQVMTGNTIPDDAARLRLTVIGDDGGRVAQDLGNAPALAPWKDRLVVQTYPPNHWAVAKTGFFTQGRPTIYVQTPTGKVLHRQDDYADGADGLARALRRADPNYDPKKDPDLRRSVGLDLSRVPTPVWIGAAGLLLLFRRRPA
jgi:hypothetical protein